jgi:hypothetical protein
VLTVSSGPVEQVTMASATVEATSQPVPASVTWGGLAGTADLACPDTRAYEVAFAHLRTTGERTTERDATDEILALGVSAAATPEALVESIAAQLALRFAGGDLPAEIGLSWNPKDGPTIATIDVMVRDDDSVAGHAYTIDGRSSDAGWEVERAMRSSICSRGSAGDVCV